MEVFHCLVQQISDETLGCGVSFKGPRVKVNFPGRSPENCAGYILMKGVKI